MVVVESYSVAIIMCVITMLCWGLVGQYPETRQQAVAIPTVLLGLCDRRAPVGLGAGLHHGQQRHDRTRIPRRPPPGRRTLARLGLPRRSCVQPVEHPVGGGHRHCRPGGRVSRGRWAGPRAGRDYHLPRYRRRKCPYARRRCRRHHDRHSPRRAGLQTTGVQRRQDARQRDRRLRGGRPAHGLVLQLRRPSHGPASILRPTSWKLESSLPIRPSCCSRSACCCRISCGTAL